MIIQYLTNQKNGELRTEILLFFYQYNVKLYKTTYKMLRNNFMSLKTFPIGILIIILILIYFSRKNNIPTHSNNSTDALDQDDYENQQEFERKSGIHAIVNRAQKYYPDKDCKKAFFIFKEAVLLAPDAPQSISKQKAIDLTDVGFACWAMWYCFDSLYSDETEEEQWQSLWENKDFLELFNLVDRKSPITAKRIKETIDKYEEESKKIATIDKLEGEIFLLAQEDTPNVSLIAKKLKEFCSICETEKRWWQLRDLANRLIKTNISHDFSWSLYNNAIQVRAQSGGGLATIYEPMAMLRKKENNFYDAIKLFLLAYLDSESPTKNAENQIQICLRKIGFKDNSQEIKDKLFKTVKSEGINEALKILYSNRR